MMTTANLSNHCNREHFCRASSVNIFDCRYRGAIFVMHNICGNAFLYANIELLNFRGLNCFYLRFNCVQCDVKSARPHAKSATRSPNLGVHF